MCNSDLSLVIECILSIFPTLLQDISEFIEGTAGMSGMVSDSEAEDENSRVSILHFVI